MSECRAVPSYEIWVLVDGHARPCMGRYMGRCMAWMRGWRFCGDVWWGWEKCMCILPGLVRLGLSIGGGLDGDGEEVVGAISCEILPRLKGGADSIIL